MRPKKVRVVYLFGAGASHGGVQAVGSAHGILMKDLALDLATALKARISEAPFAGVAGLIDLVNELVDREADFEHVITFLDQSVSGVHRLLADELRVIFESVLRRRLALIDDEVGESASDLYAALIDMYNLQEFNERLHGCLTLNYDAYLETAVRVLGYQPDFGIPIRGRGSRGRVVTILKLHGSFSWSEQWPVTDTNPERTLWIPPGIQKAKERYPFNVLWGRARELLDCDVLRIVGCQLGANDWDLLSLLFSTRHAHAEGKVYDIEIIDSPWQAQRVRESFPYLDPRSIVEVEPIASQLVPELVGGAPRGFLDLSDDERRQILTLGPRNWFQVWLKHKAETTYSDLGTDETKAGHFSRFLERSV
jgi:hypothetical protein